MLKISVFCIKAQLNDGSIILKSTRTGAIAKLTALQNSILEQWLYKQDDPKPDFVESLSGTNAILVNDDVSEFTDWQSALLETRNNRAHIFSLHFETTLRCQLECGYCVENGVDRKTDMTDKTFCSSVEWFDQYCSNNPEVKILRLIFFGGEPLLRKDLVEKAILAYSCLAQKHHVEYVTEIVTNGELLSESLARLLSQYNWRRVQITLDGPKEIHDTRRHGKNSRPTFDKIWNNILMLARSSYIPNIDVRLSLDYENAEYIPKLIEFMAQAEIQDKIRLSIGFIESSFFTQIKEMQEKWQAEEALKIWRHARDNGFKIPDEYTTGPLCIAQAKHSAVLQPDGNFQKCFLAV